MTNLQIARDILERARDVGDEHLTECARAAAEQAAFWAGRNAWFPGERIPRVTPYSDAGLAAHWKRGLRQVLAEERMDRCTEWDND